MAAFTRNWCAIACRGAKRPRPSARLGVLSRRLRHGGYGLARNLVRPQHFTRAAGRDVLDVGVVVPLPAGHVGRQLQAALDGLAQRIHHTRAVDRLGTTRRTGLARHTHPDGLTAQSPLELGGCARLSWIVDYVQAVYIFGGDLGTTPLPVAGHDSRTVCPRVDTTYTLRIVASGRARDVPYALDVQDTTPPSLPGLVSPNVGIPTYTCATGVTLSWTPSSDYSGISRYDWAIYTRIIIRELPVLVTIASGSVTGSATSVTPASVTLSCRTYYWSVRAVDGAGNAGAYPTAQMFTVYNDLR